MSKSPAKKRLQRIAALQSLQRNHGRADVCPICKKDFRGGWGYDGCPHSQNDVWEHYERLILQARMETI